MTILEELTTLPLAQNTKVAKLLPRLQALAKNLEAAGIKIRRRDGYSQSKTNSAAYIYAQLPNAKRERVWSCVTRQSGHFYPISGKNFRQLLDILGNYPISADPTSYRGRIEEANRLAAAAENQAQAAMWLAKVIIANTPKP